MAAVFVEGFEHGETSTTGYETGSTRVPLWNTYNSGASATIAAETSVLPGSWSGCGLRLTDTSGTVATNLVFNNTYIQGFSRLVGSFRFRFVSSLPSTDLEMFLIGMLAGGAARLIFRNSDSKLCVQFAGALTAVSAALSADTWYYVDFDWNATANPNTLKAKVDGANEGTSSLAQAATTNTNIRIGSTVVAQQGTWIIDDLVITDTGTDYPLGPMQVYGLAPASNGTHVNSGNFAQTGGTGGSWWTAMDSWGSGGGTFSSAEYIEQNVNGAGDYIEVGFESLPTLGGSDTVVGVGVAFTTWASTTGANGAIHWVYDGTTTTTIFTGDNSDTAPRYQRIPKVDPTTSWTESLVNTFKYRVGGATLIPGNPRFGAAILMVAVKPGAAPGPPISAMRRAKQSRQTDLW